MKLKGFFLDTGAAPGPLAAALAAELAKVACTVLVGGGYLAFFFFLSHNFEGVRFADGADAAGGAGSYRAESRARAGRDARGRGGRVEEDRDGAVSSGRGSDVDARAATRPRRGSWGRGGYPEVTTTESASRPPRRPARRRTLPARRSSSSRPRRRPTSAGPRSAPSTAASTTRSSTTSSRGCTTATTRPWRPSSRPGARSRGTRTCTTQPSART